MLMITASAAAEKCTACQRIGLAAILLAAAAAAGTTLAGPAATVTCGTPQKNGSVTVKVFVWADAQGKHGFGYKCEVGGIGPPMTAAQKAQRIADELNKCFKQKRAGVAATAAGPVVTITDERQKAYGVECTGIEDTTNEPTTAESAAIPGEFPYRATARLNGVPTEGIALLAIDSQVALATTAVPTVIQVYEQWQMVLGGIITPAGLVLEPRTGFNHTQFAFEITDPGLDISVELKRLETTTLVLGDANCDGLLSFGDINPFVLAVANPVAWQNTYPCLIAVADINGDGAVDFGDINPFVGLLSGS